MAVVIKKYHGFGNTEAQLLGTKAQSDMQPADPLTSAAQTIVKIADEKTAFAKIHELMCDQAKNWFELGGVLQRIKSEKWLSTYASFDDLCEHEFGFRKSKAYHLIAVYNTLLDLNVSWTEVKSVGWSKLRLLCAARFAGQLNDQGFSTRLESAKSLTYVQLEAELKQANAAATSKGKAIILKPHADQLEVIKAAVAKAKSSAGTVHDTVAIEHICLDYLSGAHPPANMPLGTDGDAEIVEWMKSLGFEKLSALISKAFPGCHLANSAAKSTAHYG